MGRPTKKTKEVIKTICDAIEDGAWDYAAAAAAGVGASTMRLWLSEDEAFLAAVTQARARAVIKAEARVFGGDPLKWLTRGPGRRHHPDPDASWSDHNRVELTGADGGPVEALVNIDERTQDAAREFLRKSSSD